MLIQGKEIASTIKEKIKQETTKIEKQYPRVPKLTVILVGEDPASQVYIRNKEKACSYVGFDSDTLRFPESMKETELLEVIDQLNQDQSVDGILVQLPLPKHIDETTVLKRIDPFKDVDGFHPHNIANLFLGKEGLVPCTPKGMMVLLESINYDLEGKEVVVVGRSNIVGKPVSLLCLQQNATVTMAHSKTKDLKAVCKKADVLIVAIGKANFITKEYVKKGAVVLDVGMNRNQENKLCGDVDFQDVKDQASYITPVPGGIGPMTITMLLENTLHAFYQHIKQR